MSIGVMSLLLFGTMALSLVLGLPMAFSLGGVGIILSFLLWGAGGLTVAVLRMFTLSTSFIFLACPLFIFMALMLQVSGLADDLYNMMYCWLSSLRGGLAMGTVLICTIFAAMSGISAAATITMGIIALPSMLKRNYNKAIALGCISAGGALGILIPPSILMIIYGLFSGVSVGKLFAGGIFPGFLLSGLFITYIGIRCLFQPQMGPVLPPGERATWHEKVVSLRAITLPGLLIIGVLGSIFAGIASPTEAAAVGALGSIICVAIHRKLSWKVLKEANYGTLRLGCMVMWIALGASCFSGIYIAMRGPELIEGMLRGVGLGPWGILIIIQVTLFVLGMVLDQMSIIMITTPLFVPIITSLGFDPLWFGIVFVVNMEMAYLTPPFGFNLFYLRAVAPEGVSMTDIYRSIAPFVLLQMLGLAIIMIFPQIATFLPNLIFG